MQCAADAKKNRRTETGGGASAFGFGRPSPATFFSVAGKQYPTRRTPVKSLNRCGIS